MVQYEFRNYFPEIARWDSRDPLGEQGGLNLYAFVGNNPVNWVDPWGLRIQIMGDPTQQAYILEQLRLFIRGDLSISEDGMLSRTSSKGDESIECDVDELIGSGKVYRIFAHRSPEHLGAALTVPTLDGADIFFDPKIELSYSSGFLKTSRHTPASALAHELLGRATQIERNIPHGRPGTETRKRSNERAVDLANRAFVRMGLDKRTRYDY